MFHEMEAWKKTPENSQICVPWVLDLALPSFPFPCNAVKAQKQIYFFTLDNNIMIKNEK